nr:hypothetical protein [Nanoarchaeum sp.]
MTNLKQKSETYNTLKTKLEEIVESRPDHSFQSRVDEINSYIELSDSLYGELTDREKAIINLSYDGLVSVCDAESLSRSVSRIIHASGREYWEERKDLLEVYDRYMSDESIPQAITENGAYKTICKIIDDSMKNIMEVHPMGYFYHSSFAIGKLIVEHAEELSNFEIEKVTAKRNGFVATYIENRERWQYRTRKHEECNYRENLKGLIDSDIYNDMFGTNETWDLIRTPFDTINEKLEEVTKNFLISINREQNPIARELGTLGIAYSTVVEKLSENELKILTKKLRVLMKASNCGFYNVEKRKEAERNLRESILMN